LKDPAVFSDFDGTITQRDVIISIMEQFAPEEWKKIHSDLMTGVIDVDLGIKKMFNLIPSEKKDEIVQWCKENVKLRDGFEDFLLFLKKRNIPFIILSGGVDFYIYPIMEPYMDLITKIYSNRGIFSGNYIDVDFIYKCNSLCKRHCGICKPYILKNYKDKNSLIYIGDGITDLDGALYSDIIFATGYLVDYLQKLHIKYNEYYNFYDIKIKLQRLL